MARIADRVIDQSGRNYNHPARTILAVILLNTAIGTIVGTVIAIALTFWIKSPDGFTWTQYAAIAGGTVGFQIALAIFNSIVMVPIAIRMSTRLMQRRHGFLIDQAQIEQAELETESPSKIGPAAVVATATVVALIQQDAPNWATITLGITAAALSPLGRHLTNHKDIVTLWRGIKESYYSATTKRATKR